MWRIVQLEGQSLVANLRPPEFAHEWIVYPASRADQVVARLAGAQIAILNKLTIDASAIAALPDLRLIAVSATGANNIDLEACRKQGIVVSNIRGYADKTVPEHVFAMLLALSRNLMAWRSSMQAGHWPQSKQFCLFDHPIRDLHGGTLGIVGAGSLGRGVARLANAFGMHVLFAERRGVTTPRPGYTTFDQVIATADVLSLHCPLNDETLGLIGGAELRAMKPTALLINTARGGIVDESALARALREGWIGGAGFDVLTSEPPETDHQLLAQDLLSLPNFLLTPHVAWSSRPAMQVLADQLIDNIEAFVAGHPRNRLA